MIKIEHPRLDNIAHIHYQACHSFVLPRLLFYIDFFNVLANKKYVVLNKGESIVKKYNLTDKTIFSLINPFLIKGKNYNNNKFNVSINEVKTLLTTHDNHIIQDASKYYREFRDLHSFFSIVNNSLRDILTGKPARLGSYTKCKISGTTKECVEKVFSYETFIDKGFPLKDGKLWNNYRLAESLGISVCPYCNRNWINTVTNGIYINKKGERRTKVTSPQFDHFFSKSEYPLLRLSFFNLIPSCETCNARLKGSIEFEYNKNLHPYEEGYGNDCKFEVTPCDYDSSIGVGNKYNITLNSTICKDPIKIDKINVNYEVFEIETIYKEHGDVIAEIYYKKKMSNDKYLDMLKVQFPSGNLTREELYRIAFGNYYDEIDFKRRPFAKLTKDVAEQLGLLK